MLVFTLWPFDFQMRIIILYSFNWHNKYFDQVVLVLTTLDPLINHCVCLWTMRKYRDGYASSLGKVFSCFKPSEEACSGLQLHASALYRGARLVDRLLLLDPHPWEIQEENLVSWTCYFFYQEKPRGIRPRRCSPSPQGAKYITVTKDTSPSLWSERGNYYLFGRAKTRGLGQVITKKSTHKKNGYY